MCTSSRGERDSRTSFLVATNECGTRFSPRNRKYILRPDPTRRTGEDSPLSVLYASSTGITRVLRVCSVSVSSFLSSFLPLRSFLFLLLSRPVIFFLSSFRPARTNLAEIPQIRRCMPCVTYSKALSYDTIGGSLAVCSRLSNPPSGSLVVLYNRSIIVRYSTVLLKPEREIFLSAPRLSIICYFRRDQFFLHMKVTKGDKVLFEGLKFRSVS